LNVSGNIWYLNENLEKQLHSTISGASYPISVIKARHREGQPLDFVGFDLGSHKDLRESIEGSTINNRTHIVQVPDGLKKPNHLLLLRTVFKDKTQVGGYFIELDAELMAATGGVDVGDYNVLLRKFSESSEFDVTVQGKELIDLQSHKVNDGLIDSLFKDNGLISTFGIGTDTLVLNIGAGTKFTTKLILLTVFTALLIPCLFMFVLHLNDKRRHAQRLRSLESEKLYDERRRAAVTLSSITDGVITTSAGAGIIYANRAAENLLGEDTNQLRGRSIDDVFTSHNSYDGDEDTNDVCFAADDGREVYLKRTESPLEDSDGVHTGQVVVLRDVSAERTLTKALEYEANHDLLTGLPNRAYFERNIETLFQLTEGTLGYGLCFIDLDRFKEVNDTCGHGAGDELLVRIAGVLTESVREVDLVARLGGDEFGVVLRHLRKADAIIAAERIRGVFQNFYFEHGDHVFPVRCSIGVVHFDPTVHNREQVMNAADSACFDAKNKGRNSISTRNVDDIEETVEFTWLPKIKAALEDDGFVLKTQPIVASQAGTVAHHEILLRMIDSDVGEVSPLMFMNIAIRGGVALQIDRWVLENGVVFIADAVPEYPDTCFCINVSAPTLKSDEYFERLKQLVLENNISPSSICFEFSEKTLLKDPPLAIEFCNKLRAFGCLVALDDFGASMSSLQTLTQLPVDVIKYDGGLLEALFEDPENLEHSKALLRSLQVYAESVGIQTIAEQVEIDALVPLLRELGDRRLFNARRFNLARQSCIGMQPVLAI